MASFLPQLTLISRMLGKVENSFTKFGVIFSKMIFMLIVTTYFIDNPVYTPSLNSDFMYFITSDTQSQHRSRTMLQILRQVID